MDNIPSQDFSQAELYQGSRGPVEVRTMVVTYAHRALDKVVRDHGHGVLTTPLGQALIARASLEGSIATQVDSISGNTRMLRGAGGRFVGGYLPKERSR